MRGLQPIAANADSVLMENGSPRQIECLACGASRVVFGTGPEETGGCPHCGYLGWTYSDDLDGTTRRTILNGAAKRPSQSIEPGGSRSPSEI